MDSKEQIILAVDPGFDRCGIAIIHTGSTPSVKQSWCISTNKKDSHSIRLATVFKGIEEAIVTHSPDAIALETLFFSVNKKTVIAVAEARGIIVTLAGLHNIPLIELSPQEVKIAMTGSGNADKKAVQKMVEMTLKVDTGKKLDDEIDAIALGMAASGVLKLQALAK
ncbi:MAG TPA: crossover junction endodeoxyribonuclease RuvC [Candidatus Paceibacterota bacterium]|jgi:crossover junction endodeoxyribonuclease RuvC|nr:crossover junction endodeoxyribonuclease RuvC [Candidatus Paceibacterota bacterium]